LRLRANRDWTGHCEELSRQGPLREFESLAPGRPYDTVCEPPAAGRHCANAVSDSRACSSPTSANCSPSRTAYRRINKISWRPAPAASRPRRPHYRNLSNAHALVKTQRRPGVDPSRLHRSHGSHRRGGHWVETRAPASACGRAHAFALMSLRRKIPARRRRPTEFTDLRTLSHADGPRGRRERHRTGNLQSGRED